MTQIRPPGSGAVGLVLAAGGGSRFGRPKALVEDAAGPWLERAARLLLDGGCNEVVVVLGAAAEEADLLVRTVPSVSSVVAHDWNRGLSASLEAGLGRLAMTGEQAAVITLVDLPDLNAAVVARLLDRLGTDPWVVGRACFHGRPGHPVLIGRGHWDAVVAESHGDAGARDFLDRVRAPLVECGDLAEGKDMDTAAEPTP